MLSLRSRHLLSSLLAASILATACAGADHDADLGGSSDDDPPLADVDELLAGAPKGDTIPRELGKYDGLVPAVHTSLRPLMSPVKNQAKRGVCSIFSTIGLMEHLYIAANKGTQDFSEQYLQWSAKFQVGSFPNSSGSTASANLQAINIFGIVKETVWPYEPVQWNVDNDAACTGEDTQPTFCYTNGQPTDAIKKSPKFKLPPGKFLNPKDLKAHIVTSNTAAIVDLTFFYQSWNHRKSELPTNPAYWDQGYVLYPNDGDFEISLENRAGHSIVILGWDDTLEVPIMDENGEQVLDQSGEPVVEKGFYIFKNSWGTEGFGIEHELGAGYGYISQRYVNEFGSVRIAKKPL